jgi:hypothetical protein
MAHGNVTDEELAELSLGALRKPPRPLYAGIYAPTSRLFRMQRTTR